MSLPIRLKKLRSILDKSQLEMGRMVGVTQVAWQQYEADRSVPGGLVLKSLVEQSVNVRWLLTGQGEMFASQELEDPNEPGEVARKLQRLQHLEQLIDELGLSKLVNIAHTSHLGDEWAIMVVMAEVFPSELTREELAHRLAERGSVLDSDRLETALELLQHRSLIRCSVDHLRYSAQSGNTLLNALDLTGHVQALKSAIRVLSSELLPGLKRAPKQNKLLQIRFNLDDDRIQSTVEELRKKLMEEVDRTHTPTGANDVRVILGISVNRTQDSN